jgi:toxin ParE1/3/4
MSNRVKITFAESAIQDLEDVLRYYQEKDLPHIGERLVNNVFEEIEQLADQPDMGRMVPEFELEYLKELVRPPFRIVYRREQKNVRIVRIWRSERLLTLPE